MLAACRQQFNLILPTYWLVVTRENGTLKTCSMSGMKLMYLENDVGNSGMVLYVKLY